MDTRILATIPWFRGTFASAVYTLHESSALVSDRQILCACDCLGVKPLYGCRHLPRLCICTDEGFVEGVQLTIKILAFSKIPARISSLKYWGPRASIKHASPLTWEPGLLVLELATALVKKKTMVSRV